MKTKVVVSGGFDPVHIGHIRMFKEAKQLGDELIVIINNDNWIEAKGKATEKKTKPFYPEKDRVEIISSIKYVDRVILTKHKKGTKDLSICESLKELKPDVSANGGDRKANNIPEYELCNQLGIKMVFGVGGKKIRSSTELIKGAQK